MPDLAQAPRLTRRQLLIGSGAGAVAVGGGAYAAARLLSRGSAPNHGFAHPAPNPMRTFLSRPDLRPTPVAISGTSSEPGYLFIGPGTTRGVQPGPLIVDAAGEPVWFRPLPSHLWETNFTVSSYGGQPVLTWWEGAVQTQTGYGQGEAVIIDSSYRELGRVRAAGGRLMDMHEFRLTPDGTALFTCYPEEVKADLSPVGADARGPVLDSIFQEVDVASGRLVMEWSGLEHIPLSSSYRQIALPYDYLHLNSIDITPDGHLLVSARHASALYKLDRRTGEVIWQLGGKRSDFAVGRDARFSWQHDARQVDERTITVFDNGSDGRSHAESQSRALLFDVDEAARTVRLRRTFTRPRPVLATALGSVQTLTDGHVVVGWGESPYVTEFAPDGRLVADAAMAAGQHSYKTVRLDWKGFPLDHPAIAATRDPHTGRKTLYASWNGATEVTHWQVQVGSAASNLAPFAVVNRTGFETVISVEAEHRYAAVTALDASARKLATSRTVAL